MGNKNILREEFFLIDFMKNNKSFIMRSNLDISYVHTEIHSYFFGTTYSNSEPFATAKLSSKGKYFKHILINAIIAY